MAGYMYSQLKQLLTSNEKNWTPNNIRCIVITPQFIFIAKHIGVSKGVILDSRSAEKDLVGYSHYKSLGSLSNLLMERQLSCLEEIYLDVSYFMLPNAFDIERFVSTVKTTQSRLRYYGCVSFPETILKDLRNLYDVKLKIIGSPAYSFTLSTCDALKPFFKRCLPLENAFWYTKYNLRPTVYSADKETGDLAVYFRKVKKFLEGTNNKEKKEKTRKTVITELKNKIAYDRANVQDFRDLHSLIECCKEYSKKDEMARKIYNVFTELRKEFECILSVQDLIEVGLPKEEEDIIWAYLFFRVMTVEKKNIDETLLLGSSRGLLDVSMIYRTILKEIFKNLCENRACSSESILTLLNVNILPVIESIKKYGVKTDKDEKYTDCTLLLTIVADIFLIG